MTYFTKRCVNAVELKKHTYHPKSKHSNIAPFCYQSISFPCLIQWLESISVLHKDRGGMDLKVTSLIGAALIVLLMGGCYEKKNGGTQPVKAPSIENTATPSTPKTGAVSEPEEIQYHQNSPLVNLPVLSLYLGKATLNAELAISLKEIATGMMFRKELAENAGMLFVYPFVSDVAFYMKNTYIPLSCAYIDAEGVIQEIYDMKPLSEESIPSKSDKIRFILEVNQGWFEKQGIGPGTLITTEKGPLSELFPLTYR